jgi:imidazolonepropionase-like amidohydrolase
LLLQKGNQNKMARVRCCSSIVLLLFATSAATAETYIRAGQLVDVLSGTVRADQIIVIDGDRVVRIASADEVRLNAAPDVIDLSEHTVLPGLIDLHDHLTGDHRFHGYGSLAISVPRETLYGVLNARKTIDAGFTSVRNVGASGYSDVALRDAINDGEIVGPRMRVSGPSLGITGGHCDNNLLPREFDVTSDGVADGPDQVLCDRRGAFQG